jgi:hypothetical protein
MALLESLFDVDRAWATGRERMVEEPGVDGRAPVMPAALAPGCAKAGVPVTLGVGVVVVVAVVLVPGVVVVVAVVLVPGAALVLGTVLVGLVAMPGLALVAEPAVAVVLGAVAGAPAPLASACALSGAASDASMAAQVSVTAGRWARGRVRV